VKTRWPAQIAFVVLFNVFFHYEIRWHQPSIWIEFFGGLMIYGACIIAYIALFERKSSHTEDRNEC
jgi:hypothetical protein